MKINFIFAPAALALVSSLVTAIPRVKAALDDLLDML